MDIHQIRKYYSEANESIAKGQLFFEALEELKNEQEDALIMAYRAAGLALKAKNDWNPLLKMNYIAKANQLFDKAVKLEEDNVEVRFLRFSIQVNTPFFLGMSGDIYKDKKKMIAEINQASLHPEMRPAIVDFVLNSGYCTLAEKEFLRTFDSE